MNQGAELCGVGSRSDGLLGHWGAWLLSVAAAWLLYILNSAFMAAVQIAGAAIALALI